MPVRARADYVVKGNCLPACKEGDRPTGEEVAQRGKNVAPLFATRGERRLQASTAAPWSVRKQPRALAA